MNSSDQKKVSPEQTEDINAAAASINSVTYSLSFPVPSAASDAPTAAHAS
ncbi:hypothetical protein [Bacillus sp. FJAT-42376]|nr:hypothetical protein [Bacillus sp. FJAT-42376]